VRRDGSWVGLPRTESAGKTCRRPTFSSRNHGVSSPFHTASTANKPITRALLHLRLTLLFRITATPPGNVEFLRETMIGGPAAQPRTKPLDMPT
jgi:hypothetical protein